MLRITDERRAQAIHRIATSDDGKKLAELLEEALSTEQEAMATTEKEIAVRWSQGKQQAYKELLKVLESSEKFLGR